MNFSEFFGLAFLLLVAFALRSFAVANYPKARLHPLMPGLDGRLVEYLRDRKLIQRRAGS